MIKRYYPLDGRRVLFNRNAVSHHFLRTSSVGLEPQQYPDHGQRSPQNLLTI